MLRNLFVPSACRSMLWPPGMDTQLIAHTLRMRALAANRGDVSDYQRRKQSFLFGCSWLFCVWLQSAVEEHDARDYQYCKRQQERCFQDKTQLNIQFIYMPTDLKGKKSNKRQLTQRNRPDVMLVCCKTDQKTATLSIFTERNNTVLWINVSFLCFNWLWAFLTI